jgi:hypothetical protein
MILQFGISNFQSIRARQQLSMLSASLKDEGVDLLEAPNRKQALPVVIIYGANASGKSSILQGLRMMCQHVSNSFGGSNPNDKIPRNQFMLAGPDYDELSSFDCDFVLNGIRYHYGFTHDDFAFKEEWLYAFGVGGRQMWFERKGSEYKFGKNLKGKNRTISSFTRLNSLFLSTAAQNAHAQLTEIFNFFDRDVIFELNGTGDASTVAMKYKNGIDKRIVNFLKSADAGIVDVSVESRDIDDQPFFDDFYELISKHTTVGIERDDLKRIPYIKMGHAGEAAGATFLDLKQESRGTIRLLELLGPTLQALDRGAVLLIDEIDSSLHSMLSREVVRLFSSRETNPNGAQLILTTHDTNLLHRDSIRRDQVWFTEKDGRGETQLFPLTEISTRKSDNLEKGYLEGRFGAVPFLDGIRAALIDTDA